MSCIDLATNALVTGFTVGARAGGLAVTPDGARVVVTVPTANANKLASTATNTVLGTLVVGTGPTSVAMRR